jgi:hypothetical protein
VNEKLFQIVSKSGIGCSSVTFKQLPCHDCFIVLNFKFVENILFFVFLELCSKLPEAIQETTRAEELQSHNEFIKEMVMASLPKSKKSTVDSELKRVCRVHVQVNE